ncbi:recombinase family protein [Pseudomonas anguilliseptica]|uniref:recombinase family protein n=1 Tax=Pseudomonas anguilliseptica TaxID=53406 RepID=UPI000B80BACB|nr:recombinase family protein [Pseudomonas anguilliseptica]
MEAGLVDLASGLDARTVDLRSLTASTDIKATAWRFLLQVLDAMAEMARKLILERTKASLEAAELCVKAGGPPSSYYPSNVQGAYPLAEQWDRR